VDINLVYGVLTAGTAVSSGFAGTRAARLSKKSAENEIATRDLATTSGLADTSRMWKGVTEAMAERCAGAQNASAWFATATALFGVASTRSISDPIGVGFLVIGAGLVSVAVRALLAANEATVLVAARASFEHWYPAWIHSCNLRGSKPTDEEIAFAFAEENRAYAASLQRFGVWPFHFAGYKSATMHVSRAR
jgi:hypothetical protein